jgi:hypothetical protein
LYGLGRHFCAAPYPLFKAPYSAERNTAVHGLDEKRIPIA